MKFDRTFKKQFMFHDFHSHKFLQLFDLRIHV